ncbi:MAG: response regulator [Bacteriovoracaceae bacterium]
MTYINECCQSILVVEDDDDIRTAMIDVLESEGYHATAATNGKEALDFLHQSKKPCLVLLDMMMPIMNGREFLDKVKEDTYLAPIPVLVVSAIADKTNTNGAVGFIKKPVDIDMVLKIVNRYCSDAMKSSGVPRSSGEEAQRPRP